MPKTQVVFYQESDGQAPVVNWLRDLLKTNERAWTHCRARIELLAQSGHELRRPAADYLRDGIYELRTKHGHVQYRLFYFFHGRNIIVLAHAIIKKGSVVLARDIQRALERKRLFETNPKAHRYEFNDDEN